MKDSEVRQAVEEAAERLGASRAAIFKWRQRGIPADWKIRLVEETGSKFSFSQMDALWPFRPEGTGEKARAKANAISSTEEVRDAR